MQCTQFSILINNRGFPYSFTHVWMYVQSEQLSQLLGAFAPIFCNESDNMEHLGSGRCRLPKRGRQFWMELNTLMGNANTDFEEHHLNTMWLTRFAKMLWKEWLCYCSEAYGENGIKGGVVILNDKIAIFPP